MTTTSGRVDVLAVIDDVLLDERALTESPATRWVLEDFDRRWAAAMAEVEKDWPGLPDEARESLAGRVARLRADGGHSRPMVEVLDDLTVCRNGPCGLCSTRTEEDR